MTSRAQDLLREALSLPVNDRVDVAAELLASLDDAPAENRAEVEAAWAAEIERRATREMSGESTGVPWADVRRSAEAELRRRWHKSAHLLEFGPGRMSRTRWRARAGRACRLHWLVRGRRSCGDGCEPVDPGGQPSSASQIS